MREPSTSLPATGSWRFVVVGSIGDDLRMDYTAQGDTANLASRMEGLAEPGAMLLSENTYRLAKDFFDVQSAGPLQIKGKESRVQAYQLVKAGEVDTRIEASVARGLTRFVGRKQELRGILDAFEKARIGQGQVVGVVGEAGVGKSRLLLELRNSLSLGEYTFLAGHCLHYGSSMPICLFWMCSGPISASRKGMRNRRFKKK